MMTVARQAAVSSDCARGEAVLRATSPMRWGRIEFPQFALESCRSADLQVRIFVVDTMK